MALRTPAVASLPVLPIAGALSVLSCCESLCICQCSALEQQNRLISV